MTGENNIAELIKGMSPKLKQGQYVFVTVKKIPNIRLDDIICTFKEEEGTTLVIEKNKADALKLDYEYIAAWITLLIHSSLEAVGLTALFSNELAKNNVSCNVIAAYYHDHIFVALEDAEKAMEVLTELSNAYR